MNKHTRVGEELLGKRLVGRVVMYSNKNGFGYIRTEKDGDIFLSSYALGKIEDRVRVGSKLEFTVDKPKNKLSATNVVLIEQYKDNIDKIVLPDGRNILIKHIISFGKDNGVSELSSRGITKEQIKEHGYSKKDFNYVFIQTKNDNFRFFETGAPVVCDGQTDLKEFYAYLIERFVAIW